MNRIYTIGFTKKNACDFFELIKNNNISVVIDVRLNNTSQLAGFSKYPDIEYFLLNICNCKYISDKLFAPSEKTLKDYKDKKINWVDYVIQFNSTMANRDIKKHIEDNYSEIVRKNNICFLCSEETPEKCHRRLVAEMFSSIFELSIIHLK